MKKSHLFALWGVLFVLCAALGFLPESNGWMTAVSVLFFLPPALLLYKGDRNTVLLVRNLSALSLGVTLLTLSLNFVLAVSTETLGNILHTILVIVSAPMLCSGYWVLSLFLWACLLMGSLKLLKQ
ncbi:MAG: hypothetical protein IJD98_08390 [Oscillospiraceae bacterium]|nr:hypothetical protein [Oscillospiraceae bacterium]